MERVGRSGAAGGFTVGEDRGMDADALRGLLEQVRSGETSADEAVEVLRRLADHPSLAATLEVCCVDRRRWRSFEAAITSLLSSDVVRGR